MESLEHYDVNSTNGYAEVLKYLGADKSLARPGRKKATATKL